VNYNTLAKEKLSKEEFEIIINKGTERPFTGKYYLHKEKGNYFCKLCGEKLFSSKSKYDSGCGWPSFTKADNIILKQDTSYGMSRTEVLCKKCGAHLGHLFDDGPLPLGKRYCINSASIDFSH